MWEQRIFVSEDRCILVTMWQTSTPSTVTVATREHPSHTWGPPITLTEEET